LRQQTVKVVPQMGSKRSRRWVDTFKATVDFTLVFDPNNPAVVVIKSDLKIIGTAFAAAKIALNFKNLTSVPKASFSDA